MFVPNIYEFRANDLTVRTSMSLNTFPVKPSTEGWRSMYE